MSHSRIVLLQALTFVMLGSDLMGRTTAFNATLFLTAVFGVIASFANSFVWLCISLFLLGSAVGVSHFLFIFSTQFA